MPEQLLHLDANTSIKALHQALVSRGQDVTRTPTDWMPREGLLLATIDNRLSAAARNCGVFLEEPTIKDTP